MGKRLLICADAGGSNGYRVRLWKIELAHLATEIGRPITIRHFPPGTSKWNKVCMTLRATGRDEMLGLACRVLSTALDDDE